MNELQSRLRNLASVDWSERSDESALAVAEITRRIRGRRVVFATAGLFSIVFAALAVSLFIRIDSSRPLTRPAGPSSAEDAQSGRPKATLPSQLPRPRPGWVWHEDSGDGLAIQTPKSWTFMAEDVPGPLSPTTDFGLGTWDFPTGGTCGPREAATTVPPEGMFLVLIEYDGTQDPSDFRRRPERFGLGELGGPLACLGTSAHLNLFHEKGRFFQAEIVFGDEASSKLRRQTRQALSSLRVEERRKP